MLATAVALLSGDSGASAIPDVHATLKVTSFEIEASTYLDPRVPGQPNQPDLQSSTTRLWWAKGTGGRVEGQLLTPLSFNSASVANAQGVYSWHIDPDGTLSGGEELPYQPTDFIAQIGQTRSNDDSLQQAAAMRSGGGEARLVGEDTIAGRPAYRVEVSPGTCPGSAPLADGDKTFWFDKETLVLLGSEMHARDGRLVQRTEVTRISYNEAIDPAVFETPAGLTFAPPSSPIVSLPQSPNNGASACLTPASGLASGLATGQSTIAVGHGSLQTVTDATASAVATVASP